MFFIGVFIENLGVSFANYLLNLSLGCYLPLQIYNLKVHCVYILKKKKKPSGAFLQTAVPYYTYDFFWISCLKRLLSQGFEIDFHAVYITTYGYLPHLKIFLF